MEELWILLRKFSGIKVVIHDFRKEIGLDGSPRRSENQNMKKFSAHLNVILLAALVTAIFLTWLGPIVIRLLFTPPVSFGTNCEPAAAWSMQKLIWTQMIGLIVGALAAMAYIATRKNKTEAVKLSANDS